MKKFFTLVLHFFYIMLGLLIVLIICLYIFYSVLEKNQITTSKELENRALINVMPKNSALARINGRSLNLLPIPKVIRFTEGNYTLPSEFIFSVSDSLKRDVREYLKMLPVTQNRYSSSDGNIQFNYNSNLPVQGYTLEIEPEKIRVEYSNRQGLYYALISLKVLNVNYKGSIPCMHIEDSPDLAVRGLMLDISRDKVPTIETLKGITQLLADLKFNHLELYIEGFSFAYPSFKELWEGKETPVTGEEIQLLDSFCKAHFIDLVPNQNSFGHMMAWLSTDKYKDLAECPKGYKMLGLINTKTTLDPSDPGSLELVAGMTDDLLPNFSSSSFNVNLDEPFELGKGKSKELCKTKGEGEVYLDYAKKIHDLVTRKNKKMLMWGDVVMRHPELIPQIPKDITLLDWGYESSYPYERHCKLLQVSGLNYMVCPGTNSWTSITGRTDNMLATIEAATTNGFKYGAVGMILTDWGDMGHWQYLPVSYAGYTAGGALSWNSGSRKYLDLDKFLNSYVFRDKNSVMGDLALNLGRYNRFEEIPLFNMTTTVLSLQFGLRDKVMISGIFDKVIDGINDLMKDLAPEMTAIFTEKYENRHAFDYDGLTKFIDSEEALLVKARITTSDSLLIRDEYHNAIRLIRFGAGLQNYVDFRRKMSISEQRSRLKSMQDLGKQYLEENKRLWMLRNKSGGYDRSTLVLNSLMAQIDDRLILLDKSVFSRGLNRFLEMIGTAGAVLYLKVS